MFPFRVPFWAPFFDPQPYSEQGVDIQLANRVASTGLPPHHVPASHPLPCPNRFTCVKSFPRVLNQLGLSCRKTPFICVQLLFFVEEETGRIIARKSICSGLDGMYGQWLANCLDNSVSTIGG